jgi:PWWP domain
VEAPDTVVQPAGAAPAEGGSTVKELSAAAAASDASVEPNGTSSTSKRPQNGKRKSTGGVPEHKTKKLNKKKSMPKITHLDAQPGEYYFARLKSYPPWPAVICDEGMLPHSLLSTRPVTTKQADGTYKEAYGDGGKRVHERTFPIMFLHTNEL